MHLKNKHFHLVGIGGIGMSSIAKVLLIHGFKVSGSDISISNSINEIISLGGKVFIGHDKKNIEDSDIVIVSSAIQKNNVEIKTAKSLNIPVVSRAKILKELSQTKCSITVSGSHGKTSTTGLISNLLKVCGYYPTTIVGGILKENKSNAIVNDGNLIIFESDESDGKFHNYSPSISVITNIDLEHLEFYNGINSIKSAFLNFINKTPYNGIIILSLDNKPLKKLLTHINRKKITFGIKSNADLQANDIKINSINSTFSIKYQGIKQGNILLNSQGIHNIYNVLATVAVGIALNIPFKIIKNIIKHKQNIKRRMEILEEENKVLIIDDYAHHPTEISATLNTICKTWPQKRKIVVFQPHRVTRTKKLFKEFSNSFNKANILILLPVYEIYEKDNYAQIIKKLFKVIKKKKSGKIFYVNNFETCLKKLKIILKKQDILITLGAGNVYKIGEFVVKNFKYNETSN